MATTSDPGTETVRRQIEAEREKLADAVDELREAADVTAIMRSKLPVVAAGAAGVGFFLAGGIGATMRLFARRGREGKTKAKAGRFSLVRRD
jgi:Protein of unknown function (DUF3618)